MEAKIISLEHWKAAHPPALVCWQHGLACALAWQQLWVKMIFRWP
jgi:hypothetical protein